MSGKQNLHRALAVLGACAAAAMAIAGPASAAEKDDDADTVKACLYQNELKRTKVLDDRNILFVTRDGQTYANTLPRHCPSLRPTSLLNYTFESRRICSGSRFQVLMEFGYQRVPTFICPLGMFVPISDDEAEDLIALTSERDGRRRRRNEREMIQTAPVELPAEETSSPTP